MSLSFCDILQAQCALHPSFTPQDAIKLCYQASFGAEHLLTDVAQAQRYFEDEYANITTCFTNEALFEAISPEFCRVNLRAWKQKNLPADWLFRLFAQSVLTNTTLAVKSTPNTANTPALIFHQNLECIPTLCKKNVFCFSVEAWQLALTQYLKDGVRAVHHSDTYRKAEQPAYRLVHTRFLPLLPILEHLAALPLPKNGKAHVLAIDGRCGAGKTTLAATLSAVLQTDVVHMDDFFLPIEKRTAERLATPGGNVDHERFTLEVSPHLTCSAPFAYQRFSCASMQLADMQHIAASPWRIVEGSYSHHPLLQDYANVRIFVDVKPDVQMERICHRNGEDWAKDFKNKWIPLEEAYFTTYNIAQQADILLS